MMRWRLKYTHVSWRDQGFEDEVFLGALKFSKTQGPVQLNSA